MTSSWQNRALGRSRKEPVAALPASLAKFDPPYPSLSLQQRRATLRAIPPSSAAIIRSPKRNLYIPISLELRSKARYSAPLPKSPSFSPSFPNPTALAMTIARTATAIHLAYARVCAGGFMRKATCLRPLCARARTRKRGCTWVWRSWSSAATAPNFELASATNFEIYSTTAAALSPPCFCLPRSCAPRPKELQSLPPPPSAPFEMMCIRVACVRIYNVRYTQTCVHRYAWTCERTQTNTVTTPRSAGNTYPGAIFTQADRAVIPRAYPPSPSHTSTRIPLGKSRRKSYIASWSNPRCRKWNRFRRDIRIDTNN